MTAGADLRASAHAEAHQSRSDPESEVRPTRVTERGRTRERARWAAWVVLGIVLVVVLAIGASRPAGAPTPAQRAAAIEAGLRCPSCDGVSVADSSASTAVAIRHVVEARVRAGQSTAQIERFLESRYGEGILLTPPARGATSAVWVIPVVALAVAVSGIGVLFWRRRRLSPVAVADDDRTMVEEALARARPGSGSPAREIHEA